MKRDQLFARLLLTATLIAAAVIPATAHTGVSVVHDLTHGFWHPLTGLDHVIAMVAVGVIAAQVGGRALWLVPASFLAMMAFGGVLGMMGAGLPLVETGIAASIIVLGGAAILRVPMTTLAAATLVGAFAVFHGFAHGAEMPADASAATYAGGFLLATAMLHLAGIGLGLVIGRIVDRVDFDLPNGGDARQRQQQAEVLGQINVLAGDGVARRQFLDL